MTLVLQTIYGFQLGFEIAETATREEYNMKWGFTVDIGIFRLVFMGPEMV